MRGFISQMGLASHLTTLSFISQIRRLDAFTDTTTTFKPDRLAIAQRSCVCPWTKAYQTGWRWIPRASYGRPNGMVVVSFATIQKAKSSDEFQLQRSKLRR